MTKVDGGTMFHQLEARSPFLDHVLWEFAAKLPPGLRLQGGVLKAILRELVSRRVSPEVARRKKQGFSIPVEKWMLTRWKTALTNLPEASPLESQGWIQTGTLAKAVAEALAADKVPKQLWHLVVLDQWLRRETRHPV